MVCFAFLFFYSQKNQFNPIYPLKLDMLGETEHRAYHNSVLQIAGWYLQRNLLWLFFPSCYCCIVIENQSTQLGFFFLSKMQKKINKNLLIKVGVHRKCSVIEWILHVGLGLGTVNTGKRSQWVLRTPTWGVLTVCWLEGTGSTKLRTSIKQTTTALWG